MHPLYAPYGEYPPTMTQWFELTENAKRVRRYLVDSFVHHGRSPKVTQIARDLKLDQNQTWHSLWQLQQAVGGGAGGVVFVPGTEDILKMVPFSNVPTRHAITIDGESKWYAGCAGESCSMDGLFPGKIINIDSVCLDCWEPIRLQIKDRKLLALEPSTAVLHWGMHPAKFRENWVTACDSINFFVSKDHVAAWERAVPQKRGVVMPIEVALRQVDDLAARRATDYDLAPRGGDPATMIERFKKMGLDVSAWEV